MYLNLNYNLNISNIRLNYMLGILLLLCISALLLIYAKTDIFSYIHPNFFESSNVSVSQLNFTNSVRNTYNMNNMPACVHPKLNVDDPFMMSFVRKVGPTDCSKAETDWVFVHNGTLVFDQHAILAHKSIECDYHSLQRDGEDKVTYAAPITNITNLFPIKDHAFKVTCRGEDGKNYSNIHQGVALMNDYLHRKQVPLSEGFEGMSIALFGFDSMSRMSWLRRLPLTRKYLVDKLGAIELESHNVVGGGTVEVMLPMLTGKNEHKLPEIRKSFEGVEPLDELPWIWRDFHNAGYLTSWSNGKDTRADTGPLNWKFQGFNKQPTDFYSRPFYIAAFEEFKRYPKWCLGSQSRQDIWVKWFEDMFHMYKHQRKFLLNFLVEVSHDDNNPVTEMDEKVVNMVKHLHEDGYLNNTVLILMGDHGCRYGPTRKTLPGKLEERLPYFSFLFPEWFLEKFPEAIKNLKTNAKRLTTPFDIHETFRDFIKFDGTGKGDLKNRGISLFKEIPLERTCADAAIPMHWCACLNWTPIEANSSISMQVLQTITATINGYTEEYRQLCAWLVISNVSSIETQKLDEKVLKIERNPKANESVMTGIVYFHVTFSMSPSEGLFEVTVQHNTTTGLMTLNEEDISRINKHGDQPHCIMDKNRQLRPYCYCHEQLK